MEDGAIQYLLFRAVAVVASGELLFLTDGLWSAEVLGTALRSSSGVVNNECTGDLSLYLSSWENFFGEEV